MFQLCQRIYILVVKAFILTFFLDPNRRIAVEEERIKITDSHGGELGLWLDWEIGGSGFPIEAFRAVSGNGAMPQAVPSMAIENSSISFFIPTSEGAGYFRIRSV